MYGSIIFMIVWCILNFMYVGKSDLYTVFKRDWIKLVGVFQNQLCVCVVLSEPDVANKCVFILKVLVTCPVWKTSWYYSKL